MSRFLFAFSFLWLCIVMPVQGRDSIHMSQSARTPRLAFQVYAVRDLCEKDFVGTLKAVKALGYEGVETGRFYGRMAKEIKSIMEEVGLKLVALQLYPDDLTEPKLRETLRFTKECGTDRIYHSSRPYASFRGRRKGPRNS